MSAHIEWMAASHTAAHTLTASDDWVGADQMEPNQHALVLAQDEITAIVGTADELRRLGRWIEAALRELPQ